MVRLEELKYDERGLVPCIVQDAATGEVLTLAWQSREALERTIGTGQSTYFSRSRGEIWVKGSTSGNVQAVREVRADCDRDAVLVRVTPAGPACHTGARSCFFEPVEGSPRAAEASGETLARLEQVLRERKSDAPPGSYTAKLYADENLRHKKVGEESTELVMASMRGDKSAVVREAADVVYHLLVLLQSHGIGLEQVAAELRSREGTARNPR